MTIEIGLLLTIITVGLGVLTFILNKNKSTSESTEKKVQEAVQAATANARLESKLDNINQNVAEIRLDSRETNQSIKSMSEKLTKIEQRVNQHDEIIHKLEDFHTKKS